MASKKNVPAEPTRTFVLNGVKVVARSPGHACSLLRAQGVIKLVELTGLVDLPEEDRKVIIAELKS